MADDTQVGGVDALFNGTDAQTPEVAKVEAVTPTPEAPKEEAGGQPRAADGKFAPKQTEPEATPQPASPTPANDDPEKQPISKAEFKGYIEERDKRQKLERERDELRQRIQDFESRQQAPQFPSADNPEAFAQYVEQTKTNTVFDVSETMAREKHGDEAVTSAMDWALQRAQQSPHFAAEYLKQKHPIDWAVKQQKRQTFLDDIGEDPEAYRARIIAEHLAAQGATPSQAQQPAATPQQAAHKPAPKPSLASAPTAGGIQTVPAKAPFEAVFSS